MLVRERIKQLNKEEQERMKALVLSWDDSMKYIAVAVIQPRGQHKGLFDDETSIVGHRNVWRIRRKLRDVQDEYRYAHDEAEAKEIAHELHAIFKDLP